MKIIFDTNFLIYCAREKFDYVCALSNLLNEKYELVVPTQVVEELKKLRDDKYKKVSGKDKDACNLALELLKNNGVKEIAVSGKSVDEGIINLSRENPRNIVCTLDREMRKILGRVILISRGKKLILTR